MVLLHRLVYHVFLATVAFANLVPRSESDVTIHSMENSTLADISPGAVVYQYADLMSAPKSEDQIVSSAALISGESGNSQGTVMPIIRMSGPWQHIGELQNEELYNPIHDALVNMCPYERGHMGCYSGMRGLPPQVTISDVPYRTNKGNYATNAWVTIKVEASFRELKYPGIGAALFKMAAGIYKRATADLEYKIHNCYPVTFNNEPGQKRFCNVPQRVMITFNEGKITEAWLIMTVEFNGATKNDTHNFETTKSAINLFWRDRVLPDAAKAMGNSEADWRAPCIQTYEDKTACQNLVSWRDCPACDL